MTDAPDAVLLAEFARNDSEAAFAALVERHIGLVYSVALRHTANPQHAQDITQAVFIVLARKAGALGCKTVLPGWLYHTARLTAANFQRAEARRVRREQEAFMQSTPEESANDIIWRELSPQLDEAMACLGARERDALVSRYFQNKSVAEVGKFLGLKENAAQKRVSRALDKLRKFFAKRGVVSTAAIIAGAITANSIQAAPAGLAKTISAVAIAKGTAASVSTLTLVKGALKVMAWTKAKMAAAIAVGVLLAGGAATVAIMDYWQHAPPKQSGRLKLPTGDVPPMVAYGYSHFGIILASDGSLWSWGEEAFGWPTLGLKNVQNSVSLRRIGNENDWVNVAVGGADCLAIKSDGSLWGWGENLNYQLGDGTKITRATPVRSIPGNDWKQAATGGSASFALKNDGTLWAWGNNWAGNLGTGDTKNRTNAVQISSSTNWTKIWAGGIQTVGLQSDGTLWFWGSLTGDSTSKISVPNRISPDTNWMDVCFGYFTVFAVKSDGTLWSWGRDAHFYTGAGTNVMATPMQIGTDTDWQSCASGSGGYYELLMKKDGSLWALDASEHRIVKPWPEYKPIKFVKIDLHKDIVAYVAGGDNMGAALTRDGEVWTWGNALGEHAPKDFFGKNRNPKYKVIDKPWQLENVDSVE
jgi:RNA polymerase sigma factor (sigma-70 family)